MKTKNQIKEVDKIKWRSEIFKEHLRKVGFRLPSSEDYFASIGDNVIIVTKTENMEQELKLAA